MKRNFILTVLWVVVISFPTSATIINIPDEYETIQQGIDASSDGDTVLVQPGTYVENINFNGHNIVLGSLFLTTRDESYISSTIIDGDASGSVVTFESGEDSTAVITGFTIQNGYGWGVGGGINCADSSNPMIMSNIICGNRSIGWVGAQGGGIACFDSDPTISNNIISENYASADAAMGGGIGCNNSNPTISNNNISGNSTSGSVYLGGGIGCAYGSSPVIVNNIISANSARLGGGIFCQESSPTMTNNTIRGNSADQAAGIYCAYFSNPTIFNTIFWADSAQYDPEIFVDTSSSPTIIYCDIQSGWTGEGNIDVDPLFRDPENGDFHLMSTECGDPYDSPCIDAGHPDIIDSLLDCSWGLGTILSNMGAYGGGDSATVGIIDQEPRVPDRFALLQNYPNPFNAQTVIRYSLPSESDVTIKIFDILGRKVETLVDEKQRAGYHKAVWNAIDRSSGIYFYRIQAGEHSETRKMLLIR